MDTGYTGTMGIMSSVLQFFITVSSLFQFFYGLLIKIEKVCSLDIWQRYKA